MDASPLAGSAPADDPLAAVRNPDGTINWLEGVGEAEHARREGLLDAHPPAAVADLAWPAELAAQARRVLDWLNANGYADRVRQAGDAWRLELELRLVEDAMGKRPDPREY